MKNSKLKMTLKVKRTLEMKGASKKNTSLAAPGALTQRCTPCKIQNGLQLAPKWSTGLERGVPLGFRHCPQILLNKFLGSMLPQYMALLRCVTLRYVTSKKKFKPLLSKVGG